MLDITTISIGKLPCSALLEVYVCGGGGDVVRCVEGTVATSRIRSLTSLPGLRGWSSVQKARLVSSIQRQSIRSFSIVTTRPTQPQARPTDHNISTPPSIRLLSSSPHDPARHLISSHRWH